MKYPNGRLAAAIMLALSAAVLSVAGSAAPAHASTPQPSIMPNLPWFDNNHKLIQGHNGSVILDSSSSLPKPTYFWIGQDLTDGRFGAACYQSTDLMQWTRDEPATPNPDVLTVAASPAGMPGFGLMQPTQPSGAYYLIGNTQVMYDSANSRYILWVSISIKDADPRPSTDFLVDVAWTQPGQTPCGPYTWVQSTPWQPFNHPVGDIGLFNYTPQNNGPTYTYLTDADQLGNPCSFGDTPCYETQTSGSGKLVTTNPCQPNDTGCSSGPELRVFLINSDDTGLEGTVLQLKGSFEAPAMFQAGSGSHGPFFLLASHKTSWLPNDNQYNYSQAPPPTSTSQPVWSGWQTAGGQNDDGWQDVTPDDPYTCDSQTFFVLPVQGTTKTTYIYMGDRWDSSHIAKGQGDSLGDSGYVWLPLQVSTSTPSLSLNCNVDNWSIVASTGVVTTHGEPTFTFTNASGWLLDGQANGNVVQAAADGKPDQEWEIINVGYSAPGPLYTPLYAIVNVAATNAPSAVGSVVMQVPCSSYVPGQVFAQCAVFSNPLVEDTLDLVQKDYRQELWQFVSVDGGPELTLKSPGTGNLVDVQHPPDGSTLVQDAPQSPPASSQQWTLTETSG